MKNKIVVLVIMVLMLCGCESNTVKSKDDFWISFYTDSVTCVEYLKYDDGYSGGLSVRYNTDGTIKLNKECMEARNER
jgi:hypothetical protein